MSDAINDLITRLESATGPDRDLDAAIARDVMGFEIHDWPERYIGRSRTHDVLALQPVLGYTGLLDDAMTLVLGRFGVTLHRYLDMNGRAWASVVDAYPSGTPFPVGAIERPAVTCAANSMPLALCIAALRMFRPVI